MPYSLALPAFSERIQKQHSARSWPHGSAGRGQTSQDIGWIIPDGECRSKGVLILNGLPLSPCTHLLRSKTQTARPTCYLIVNSQGAKDCRQPLSAQSYEAVQFW